MAIEDREEQEVLDLPGTLRTGTRMSPRSHGGCCFEGIDSAGWAQAVQSKTATEGQPEHGRNG